MSFYRGIIKYLNINYKRLYTKYIFSVSNMMSMSNMIIDNINIDVVKNFISNITRMRNNKKIDYG